MGVYSRYWAKDKELRLKYSSFFQFRIDKSMLKIQEQIVKDILDLNLIDKINIFNFKWNFNGRFKRVDGRLYYTYINSTGYDVKASMYHMELSKNITNLFDLIVTIVHELAHVEKLDHSDIHFNLTYKLFNKVINKIGDKILVKSSKMKKGLIEKKVAKIKRKTIVPPKTQIKDTPTMRVTQRDCSIMKDKGLNPEKMTKLEKIEFLYKLIKSSPEIIAQYRHDRIRNEYHKVIGF